MCSVLAVMAVSAAASAYSAHAQGQAQKKLGEYNAQVAENNAKTEESQAKDAAARGQIAEDQHRSRVRQMLGSQRATMAAAGGDLTDQSSAAILSDTARFGELDALTVRSNAAREAWGFSNAAADSRAQGVAGIFQAKAAGRAGNMEAASSLLSSGSKMYGMSAGGK